MNVPYGKVWSTLGTSMKYMRPAAGHMAAGAAAGITASYITGDGHMLRDGAIGALGGLGYQKGIHRDIMAGGRTGAKSFNATRAMRYAGLKQRSLWNSL